MRMGYELGEREETRRGKRNDNQSPVEEEDDERGNRQRALPSILFDGERGLRQKCFMLNRDRKSKGQRAFKTRKNQCKIIKSF